jgi:hypothetical protein
MSLSAATVFEVRQPGSDTNGGGFVAGASGTDFSQQNAAQIAVTDAVTNGTTTITSATAGFGATHVGNIIYVAGGTGSVAAQWYQVVSVTNATTIVVDRSTGLTAGTGVTLNLGGALATPGALTNAMANGTAGIRAYVKYSATAYAITTATGGPAGPCNVPNFTSVIEGYDVTRGDRTGNRPTYQWTVAPGSQTYAYKPTGNTDMLNLRVDGNAQNNACGFSASVANGPIAADCVAANCSGTAGIGFAVNCGLAFRCQASSCLTGFNGTSSVAGYLIDSCDAVSCTTGFNLTGTRGPAVHCLARGCATGFALAAASGEMVHRCTADACTTAGFNATAQGAKLINCLASNCSGAGATGYVCGTNFVSMYGCATYNNLTDLTGTPVINEGPIALSADPYVNQAGADFRPNNNNPGGAQLRNAGFGIFGQSGGADIGAVQHTDPAGGTTYIFQVEG